MALYLYVCDKCKTEQSVSYKMGDEVEIWCPSCEAQMRVKITYAPGLAFTRFGGRSVRAPDRPSNAEYQAYKKWEDAGGAPDAPERIDFLKAKGEIPS